MTCIASDLLQTAFILAHVIWLLALHLAGITAAAFAGARAGIRAALLVAAVPGAATAIWAIGQLAGRSDGDPTPGFDVTWVEGLDLVLTFRASPLALVMTTLVGGIGALVFVYAAGYFSAGAAGAGRFPATLLAFATSMLGLVWAGDVWTLFIFWEFTSITSFLLVGHKHTDAAVRAAARRALLITGAGGLSLLAGLLVLAGETGSTALADLVDGPAPSGTAAAVAAVLILIGAATKSAQVPFHVWLPGAMAAPTPVSAYLHSATMVKAGVLLVAVVSPALGEVDAWRWTGLTFGIASMLWGAIGALRQRDAKLILAWGTVSQLGLLITLLTAGTAKATFAGVALLFAHALFKAALFLVVGEVDIRTGTRDIGELRGLRTSMPVAFWVTVAAAASMAGAPPLLGFAAKEAAVEAVLKLDGSLGVVVAAAVIGGAALTVAYTLRFVLGVFTEIATEAGAATTVAPLRPLMTAPSVVLAATGLLGFAVLGTVNDIILPAAVQLDPAAEAYKLYRYHGLTPALWSTVGAFVVGLPLGVALTRRVADAPRPLGARGFDRAVDGFLAAAPKAISKVQHGSLPVYLVTMSMVAAATTVPFWSGLRTDHLVVASSATEAVLALSVAIAAFAIGAVRSRLDAALALGAVGAGMTGLFVAIGAPDLALTQFLVETVIVIGFVGGLARLGRRFPPVGTTWRAVRVLVAAVSGVAVTLALIAAGAAPAGTAPIGRLADEAYETGGGKNIVNVILTDVRALDTVGEVVVLVAVSLGVLALAGAPLPRRSRAGDRHPAGPLPKVSTAADRLPESPVVRLGVELITPAAMLLGIYLLVAGHNRPGGGFAAGLVFGAVITLRALARMVIPPAIPLLGVGTAVVVASALLPLLWGDGVLDQGLATVDLPIFGSVKGGTALPFDIGVTAVVVGLIAALLHGLGDDMNDLDRLQETAS